VTAGGRAAQATNARARLLRAASWGLLAGPLVVVVAYPLGQLLVASALVDRRISGTVYTRVLAEPDYWRAFGHSLAVSTAATVVAGLIGGALAWVVARTDIPGWVALRRWLVIPYMIPPFVAAFAWHGLLGPAGYLNQAYLTLSHAGPVFTIYGAAGIVFVLAMTTYPLFLILVARALDQMNAELEEAAEISGASPGRVMRDITLRLVAPAFASAAMLAFSGDLSNFGVPALLGDPVGFRVMTTAIYATVQDVTVPNHLSVAAALSVWLALAALAVALFQLWTHAQGRHVIIGGRGGRTRPVRLGRWSAPVTAGAWMLGLVTTGGPLASLAMLALTRAYGLPPAWGNLTWQHFLELPSDPLVRTAVTNSAILTVAAATTTAAIGFVISYLRVRSHSRFAAVLDYVSGIPYVIPGTVIAIAMILAWIQPLPVLRVSIYNTLWILWLAYCARYLAVPIRGLNSALRQYDGALEEAAAGAGATPLRIVRDVAAPLVWGSLLSSWLLVAVPALNELTVSILLYGPGHETVGVAAFLMIRDGRIATAAAFGLLMILVVVLGDAVARRVSRGRAALW